MDVDRYTVNGEYRQVMLSARELSYKDLPSRGFINERLTYTHGYGLVAGPVNRISPEGLPEFFLKDIPPTGSGLPKVTRPEIYYGELGNDYVFVRTRSQELDYPSGDQNVYARYQGRGGIPVNSLLAKVAFALRFGELKVLLSDDLTRGEPRDDLSRHRGAPPRGGPVPALRPRPVSRGHRRPGASCGWWTPTRRAIATRTRSPPEVSTTSATRSRPRWTRTTAPSRTTSPIRTTR